MTSPEFSLKDLSELVESIEKDPPVKTVVIRKSIFLQGKLEDWLRKVGYYQTQPHYWVHNTAPSVAVMPDEYFPEIIKECFTLPLTDAFISSQARVDSPQKSDAALWIYDNYSEWLRLPTDL